MTLLKSSDSLFAYHPGYQVTVIDLFNEAVLFNQQGGHSCFVVWPTQSGQ